MSDDWDTKLVIGYKAKAPKVARNTSDLNGMLQLGDVLAYSDGAILSSAAVRPFSNGFLRI
jgi:hypothetical protein